MGMVTFNRRKTRRRLILRYAIADLDTEMRFLAGVEGSTVEHWGGHCFSFLQATSRDR
jgi:hypothetical protein